MQKALLNNLCDDNNVQNHLFFFTFTNFVNHVSCFETSKNNPAEILTGGCPL